MLELNEQKKALIEHLCARLVLESIAANDRQDYEAFAALFTSEGLLHRPAGEPLRGRDEIVASYRGNLRIGRTPGNRRHRRNRKRGS
jgi:hypothetical protein